MYRNRITINFNFKKNYIMFNAVIDAVHYF